MPVSLAGKMAEQMAVSMGPAPASGVCRSSGDDVSRAVGALAIEWWLQVPTVGGLSGPDHVDLLQIRGAGS
ncbi:hypothetical protein O2W18_15885 [Modestobacter sp. VKM Ac-2983]|uniref:hypothetical protein n=1 Tax=Modestobacter sp. VKM Ac-2983 TaxID=3004137 RepID=UPI0022AB7AA7|nr:hypothetical protein [Modestobacter sp. VKM Ac-2983]MCZ2806590.1 hypothetical protein [Modestobacter sp. VKM Ac-2983]